MAFTVEIDGTPRRLQQGWDIEHALGGRPVLTAEVYSRDGSYVPTLGDVIEIEENGSPVFKGPIDTLVIAGKNGEGRTPIISRLSAVSGAIWADKRYVVESAAEESLEARITRWVTDYMADFGVTIHPSQATGPTLAAESYDYVQLSAALDGLAPNWIWSIDADLQLRMVDAATVASAVNITQGALHLVGDVEVEPSREDYANRVIVRFGEGTAPTTQTWTADGVATSFTTDYPATLDIVNVITVDGATVPMGPYEPGDAGSIWLYQWDAVTHTFYQRFGDAAIANGIVISLNYNIQYPAFAQADDVGSQPPIEEVIINRPEISSLETAETFAAAELAVRLVEKKTIQYQSVTTGLVPGETQTIHLPLRMVSSLASLITEVRTKHVGGNRIVRTVIAVGGTSFRGYWGDLFKRWNGASTTSGGAALSGGSGGSGGSTTVVAASHYFLGGSMVEYVQHATPDWTPASAVEVDIDTAVRGSETALVTVRLRAVSGNVTARLRNITDGTTAGTSTVVSSSSWQTVTFAATLTAGRRTYRLEVLPGSANIDVAAVGYVE